MRLPSLRTLTVLGSLVGAGGCVSGAIDGAPFSEGSGGQGQGGSTVASGNQPGKGGQPASGGTGQGKAGSSNPTSPLGGSSSTPVGGTSSNAGSPTEGGSMNGNAGTSGSSGSGGGPGVTPHDCKRGIAWASSSLNNPTVNTKLTWWYTWGLSVQSVGAGLEFVPMVWGGGQNADDISERVRPEAKFLLGFNEPNFFAQANLSAQQAASNWPALQAVAAEHGLGLVSPAVNYCGDVQNNTGPCHDTDPVSYLDDFFAACQGCQVDYVAVHWYNCDGDSLESYLDRFQKYSKPLWVTELACAYGGDTSVAGQEKYMREAVPILEARTDVYRYSWFSGDPIPNARLLNGDGSPTPLGQIYLDLPRDPTCTP